MKIYIQKIIIAFIALLLLGMILIPMFNTTINVGAGV